MIRTTIACLLGIAAAAAAQDLTRKAAPQKQRVVLTGVTIHPVSGPVIENGHVAFENGIIVAVGPGEGPAAGAGGVLHLEGKHVYPGFISAHTQLGLTEIGAVRASRDFDEAGDVTPEVRAAVAVNPDSTLLPVTRSNGILTFATFPRGGLVPGRASLMRMDGWTWEDMAVRADLGLVVQWPRTRPAPRRRRRAEAPAPAVEKRLEAIRAAFTDAKAYAAARAADPRTGADLRWEAMRTVVAGERPVFFLADTYDQISGALEFAAEFGLKPVLVGGRDAPLCLDLIRKLDAAVILRSLHAFPARSDSDYDETYRLPAKLQAAGVRWCLASGERTANERNLPYAAGRAAAYGLDRAAALRSITLSVAEVLGVARTLGSIERRKSATLIVTDGDPLEITTRVEHAWIDGRKIDLSNKQTELYAKYREKYRQLGLVADER